MLLSLATAERHGYGILLDAEARGERIDVGTLYRALARMVDQGWIAPAPDASNDRRTTYRITPDGHRVARREAERFATMTRAARLGGLLPRSAS